jgi:hypothetical protein
VALATTTTEPRYTTGDRNPSRVGQMHLPTIPPEWKDLHALVERKRELDAEARAARAARDALLDERRAVACANREAYAEAIRRGERDPGTKGVDAHERKISEATRHYEALLVAVALQEQAIVSAVRDDRRMFEADLATERAKARADLLDLLHRAAERAADLDKLVELGGFIADPARSKRTAAPVLVNGLRTADRDAPVLNKVLLEAQRTVEGL